MLQSVQFFGDVSRCQLDDTARKVSVLCEDELQVMSSTGVLASSGRLRAILLTASLLVRIDTQELESLNSMIKIAMQRAGTTRISLELLSSRVCIRKTIAGMTNSSLKVKVVKPIAAQLAKSLYMVWEQHRSIVNDACRWAPSADVNFVENDPKLWNPSLLTTKAHKWAIQFNKKLIAAIDDFQKNRIVGTTALVVAVLVPHVQFFGCDKAIWRWKMFTPGERSRSIVMMMELQVFNYDGSIESGTACDAWGKLFPSDTEHQYTFAKDSEPQSSLDILAVMYDMLAGIKTKDSRLDGCCLHLVPMLPFSLASDDESQGQHNHTYLRAMVDEQVQICKVQRRKDYERRKTQVAALSDSAGELQGTLLENNDDDGGENASISDGTSSEHDMEQFWLCDNDLGGSVNDETHDDIMGDLLGEDEEQFNEAATQNSAIAQAASSKALAKGRKPIDPTTLEAAKDISERASSSRTVILNIHDLEGEAWLQQSMLSSGMTHATVTIHDNPVSQHSQHVEPDSEHECLPQDAPPHQLDGAFDKWVDSIRLTGDALQSRFEYAQNTKLGHQSNVSIVLTHSVEKNISDIQVNFVQWSDVGRLMGRRVTIDENDGIICPVYFMQPAICFGGCEVIHPAIGLCVRRVKKSERPIIPPFIKRLYDIYATSIRSINSVSDREVAFDDEVTGECTGCGNDASFQCGCCQKFWHTSCADSVAHHSQSSGTSPLDTYGLKVAHLPQCWSSVDYAHHANHNPENPQKKRKRDSHTTLADITQADLVVT